MLYIIWNIILICVWWDQKGIIYYELLNPKETINASIYSRQLTSLSQALDIKRPNGGNSKRKVILLHDNARPHVAKVIKETIENLGWEVLSHPVYSPDLAPSDYHLFRSMAHFFRDKIFFDIESIKKEVAQYFGFKSLSFYEKGIKSLLKRWEKVIASDGNYFDD